ncbi:MAG: RNA polymerase sigma factor [Kordiimonadaceae bacterium]|nr:RNA polymerase sigma factor [Kordiimonadaceae bacterium]
MKKWFFKNRKKRLVSGGGEQAASLLVETLYRDHFTDLCKNIHISFGGGPPEPEDIVQAAFTKFASLDHATSIEKPRSFIFIIARNLVLDYKRRRKMDDAYIAEQIALDHDFKLEGITPERVVLAKDYLNQLIRVLRTLPKKQQVILSMNRLEGKSFKQITQETGWSAGDISRNMNAGMETLIRIMDTGTPTEIDSAAHTETAGPSHSRQVDKKQ